MQPQPGRDLARRANVAWVKTASCSISDSASCRDESELLQWTYHVSPVGRGLSVRHKFFVDFPEPLLFLD